MKFLKGAFLLPALLLLAPSPTFADRASVEAKLRLTSPNPALMTDHVMYATNKYCVTHSCKGVEDAAANIAKSASYFGSALDLVKYIEMAAAIAQAQYGSKEGFGLAMASNDMARVFDDPMTATHIFIRKHYKGFNETTRRSVELSTLAGKKTDATRLVLQRLRELLLPAAADVSTPPNTP